MSVSGSRNPRSAKRGEHGNLWPVEDFINRFEELLALWCLVGDPIDLGDLQADPPNRRSDAPVQEGPICGG